MLVSRWSNMNIYIYIYIGHNIWLYEVQRGIVPSIYLWEHFVLRFANKLSSNGTQTPAMTDLALWKSSYDDMHWQQGKCYIYSWQLWRFDSCRCYDFTSNICQNYFYLTSHSLGLFVAPTTRAFCVAVKRLNGLEISNISMHQHSAGACIIVRTNPSVMSFENAYNIAICSWNRLAFT